MGTIGLWVDLEERQGLLSKSGREREFFELFSNRNLVGRVDDSVDWVHVPVRHGPGRDGWRLLAGVRVR
jgi:hypothetical protein